jgi:dihydroflavonol-4-reductase
MILVTGGTGFLGSHLLLELLKTNQQLRAIKRKNSNLDLVCKIFSYYEKDAASLMSRIDWVEGDVLDVFSLEDAFSGVTEVYHCAALVSFNPKSRNMLYDINVRGTSNVVNAALKCKIGKIMLCKFHSSYWTY